MAAVMMWLYLSVLLASLTLIYRTVKQRRGRSNLPPGPPALPVIGHLHLLKDPIYDYLASLTTRYGHNLFLRFGRVPVFITSSPSTVEECFTTKDLALADRPRSVSGDHFTYDYTFMVWAPHGSLWRTLRRVTHTEIFSLKSLQKSAYVREEEVRCLLQFFFKKSQPLSDGMKQLIDMRHVIPILTANVVMKVAAGRRCIEMHESESQRGQMAIQEFKDLFFPIVSLTLCDFIPFFRLIGYKGLEKKMANLHKRRDTFMTALVRDSREKLASSLSDAVGEESNRTSVAETLLLMQKTDPGFFTDDVIKGIVMLMFIAGTETTTYTLEWAMSLLVNHPKALKKLQDEVDSVVGRSRMVSDSDLASLPYLKSIVKETLRLYPPAPLLLPHSAIEDCTLAGYNIPKGTMVMVNAWAMHRDGKIWEDPHSFKPERFENCTGELREGFMFVPFGVGRRQCPGGNMGTQVVCLGLAAMVQCFDWSAVGGSEDMAHGTGGVSLSKVKPLKVHCSPRLTAVDLLSTL